MPKEIYNSDPISVPEVRELLLKRAEEGEELSYMQRIALEHAQMTSRISAKEATQLIDDLKEQFRLSDKGCITLANFIPDTVDEIRQLLGKEAGALETETLEQILEVLEKVDRLAEDDIVDIDQIEEEAVEEEKEVDESMIPEDLR